MSSIVTHVAFGAAIGAVGGTALGRRHAHMIALGALLAAMPDADVIGFAFGVEYESFFGHRGFFHSPFFALMCAMIAAALVHSAGRRTAACVGLMAFAAMTSHAILDALTTGGAGVMMFYPVSTERFFFSWRPIPVSPLGVRAFFSEWGVRVMLGELPFLVFAALIGGLATVGRRKMTAVTKTDTR